MSQILEMSSAEDLSATRTNAAYFERIVQVCSLFLAISIVAIAWALSTPPGFSPAERESMLAIYCGSGGATPECPPNLDEPDELQVSGGWGDSPCFIGENKSAECLLAGPNWTQYKTTVFYSQLPEDTNLFHGVLRTFVDEDPFRSLVQMRMTMALLGSALLTASLVALQSRAARYLRMWLAIGVPVVLIEVTTVAELGWQLQAIPVLVAMMFVAMSTSSKSNRSYAVFFASIIGFVLSLNRLTESVVLIILITVSVALLNVRGTFSIRRAPNNLELIWQSASYEKASLERKNGSSGISTEANTDSFWMRFCRSPIISWLSVAVLVLVNFQQHVWRQVLLYLPSQLDEFRVIRTIAQLPNFAIGFLGAGRWRLGYSDLTFPFLATMTSIAVIGVIMYVGASEARPSLRVRFAILVVLLASAVVIVHESKGIEIGGDPSLVSQFLPYFVVLMLMVPLFTETRFHGKIVHVVNGLIVFAVGASLWGTLRRYVTGFPETPYSEGPCLFCDLSPQLWWWNRWYEPVLGPRLTWLIAIVATIWALYLASKLGSKSQVADSRSARIRAVAGLVVLTLLGLRLTLPWLVELSPARWAQ